LLPIQKSIKESLKESGLDCLSALMESSKVLDEKKTIIQHKVNCVKKNIEKYALEKTEI
jgi:hypothetical protein